MLIIIGLIIVLSFFIDNVKLFAMVAAASIIVISICILLVTYLKIYGYLIIAAAVLWFLVKHLISKYK